jgi:hypothetical protein
MPSMMPLATNDHGTDSYITSCPVFSVAIVHVTTIYCLVVNHGTITSLQVFYTLFIPIMGTTFPPPFNINLPLEAHTSPG